MLSITEHSAATALLSASNRLHRDAKRMTGDAKRPHIGDVIRTERRKLGLSQRALARELRLSPGAVGQWENGSTKPSLANFIDACNLFGISVRGFIGPGAPYQGQLIEDPDELALLELWRDLPPADRPVVLRMLRNSRPAVVGERDVPKAPRKEQNVAPR